MDHVNVSAVRMPVAALEPVSYRCSGYICSVAGWVAENTTKAQKPKNLMGELAGVLGVRHPPLTSADSPTSLSVWQSTWEWRRREH